MTHLAHIVCGGCEGTTTVALGIAHAILCPYCGEEIVLGEVPLAEDFEDAPLNVVLDVLGLTHKRAPLERNLDGGKHDIYDWGGTLVATLDCHATWTWLHVQGLYPRNGAYKAQVILAAGQ